MNQAFRRQRAPGRTAFTLVELLLVLLIIGTLSSIAVPRYGTMIANQKIESAARRVAQDFEMARKAAQIGGRSVTILFAGNNYSIPGFQHLDHRTEEYLVNLMGPPYETRIVAANFGNDSSLIFDGFGMPDTGGAVFLNLGQRQITVEITAENVINTFEGFIAVTDGPVP